MTPLETLNQVAHSIQADPAVAKGTKALAAAIAVWADDIDKRVSQTGVSAGLPLALNLEG